MPDQNVPDSSAIIDVEPRRRRFLKKAAIAGLVTTLLPYREANAAEDGRANNNCRVYLSLAEALFTYMILLAKVESEASRQLQAIWNETYQQFSTAYGSLYRVAKELKAQLCKATPNAEVEQICDLAEAGLKSTTSLSDPKLSTQAAIAQAQLKVSAAISEQVGHMARCLPNGVTTLNASETEALNQLLAKVEEVRLV